MAEGRRVALGFALAGAIFIGFSVFLNRFEKKEKRLGLPQARIEALKGGASIRPKGFSESKPIKNRESIYLADVIEVIPQRDVTVNFFDGTQLKVSGPSSFFIELENESPVLFLMRGQLDVEKIGNNPALLALNGRRLTIADYSSENSQSTESPQTSVSSSDSLAAQPQTPEVAIPNKLSQSLSHEYIENTLKKSTNQFYKCFTQLLQRHPESRGFATLQFTIAKSGKIVAPEVSLNSIKDIAFKKCLLNALERIEFNSHSGEPITTIFPIKFE